MSEEQYYFYRPKDGHGLPHNPLKAIIAPRPIGWIASQDTAGTLNLAPYSFFNAVSESPPIIAFCSSGRKDTLNNIEQTGEFVWNLATRRLSSQMNTSCKAVSPEVDEFVLSGLTPVPSVEVAVPRVGESPVSFECRMTQIVQLKSCRGEELPSWLVMGEVVAVHIHKSMLNDGIYSTLAGDPILRGGGLGDYFTVGEDQKFSMARPKD